MTRQQYLKNNGWMRWFSHIYEEYFYCRKNILASYITFNEAWKLQMWKEGKPESWRPEKKKS